MGGNFSPSRTNRIGFSLPAKPNSTLVKENGLPALPPDIRQVTTTNSSGPPTELTKRRTKKKLAVAFHFGRTGGWAREHYQCGHCRDFGHYLGRNCSKYFPEEVAPGKYKWLPEYTTGNKKLYGVEGVVSEECPVSAIKPEIQQLVQIAALDAHSFRSSGATMFGSNSGQWPAWWFDLITTIEMQRVLEHNARMEAESER